MTSASENTEFRRQMLAAMPGLRAFAIALSGRSDRADDLLQETMMKAWANRDGFMVGTNMRAWLYTILRNEFYTLLRKRKREVEDAEGEFAARLAVMPEQHSKLDFGDMKSALQKLAEDQREALLLVTASDMSYEEAAQICGVAVGTIKSRVNRARARLAEILDAQSAHEFGSAAEFQAAVSAKTSSSGN